MSYEGFSSYITQGNSAVKSRLRYDASTGKFTVALTSDDNDYVGFYVFDGRDFPTMGMDCLRDPTTGIPTVAALTPLHYDSEGKLAGYMIANITGYSGTFTILGVRGHHPIITPVFVRYDAFYDQSNHTELSWPSEVAAIEVWDDEETEAFGGTTVGPTAPTRPTIDDLWTDTSNPLIPVIRRWSGGNWIACYPEVFEVVNGVVVINIAAIAQVSAGAIQTGNLRAMHISTGSRLYHPDYPNSYFHSTEFGTAFTYDTITWPATSSAWSFTDGPANTFYGPGTPGTPKFCPNSDNSCSFLIKSAITGHSGGNLVYYRINGGARVALAGANSGNGGDDCVQTVMRSIAGLLPTDRITFYVAPSDAGGNIPTQVTTTHTSIEVNAFNW